MKDSSTINSPATLDLPICRDPSTTRISDLSSSKSFCHLINTGVLSHDHFGTGLYVYQVISRIDWREIQMVHVLDESFANGGLYVLVGLCCSSGDKGEVTVSVLLEL